MQMQVGIEKDIKGIYNKSLLQEMINPNILNVNEKTERKCKNVNFM